MIGSDDLFASMFIKISTTAVIKIIVFSIRAADRNNQWRFLKSQINDNKLSGH